MNYFSILRTVLRSLLLSLLISTSLFGGSGAGAQDSTDDCARALAALSSHPPTEALQAAESASHESAAQVEHLLDRSGLSNSAKRGYGILVGTMVGSAVLTTFLSAHLPANLQFASIFIVQLSTLGVYVLGAPIWEPLSSKFRKWAFGIGRNNVHPIPPSPQLESTWTRTQENYSLNAQVSRNIIGQFIAAVKLNFYQAYLAHSQSNPLYSADQIAEAAYRMRILFKDIDPADHSVAAAIHSAFSNHIEIDQNFVTLVWTRLNEMDKDCSQPHVYSYYEIIVNNWLKTI